MNFGGIPEEYSGAKSSKVVIVPVPYDGTSTWIKGADKGPEAIMEASANMELFDIETASEPYKAGIYTAPAITENESPEKMSEEVENTVGAFIDKGKFVITLGGEHSISIGAIKAHLDRYEDVSVLQLDAHTDLREEYEESSHNHACVMARAREKADVVQVGIRSMSEDEEIDERSKVFFAHELRNDESWKQKVLESLKKRVYITLDLDVFDPSIMPSTGTPEPGGLLWYDVMDLLKMVIRERELVGFDLVELCPSNTNKAPDFLAAKLIYQVIANKYNSK